MERGSFSFAIRIVAGGYLVYLGYNLISGYINPTEEMDAPGWYILLVGIVFVALGIYFIVDIIKKQAKAKSASEEEEGESAEEGAGALEAKAVSQEASGKDGYVPPQTMTIAERIRRLSSEVEDDDDDDAEEED